jgi:hypothetical protein
MFSLLWKSYNCKLRFCAGARVGTAGCDTGVGLHRLRAGEVAKGRATIEAPRLTETLERRRKRAGGAKHGVYRDQSRDLKIRFSVQRIMRYTTVVDPGVDYDPRQFANEIDVYLSDPDGWISRGVTFVRVRTQSDADMVIHLTPLSHMKSIGCDPALSCAEFNGRYIHLNAKRWGHGAPPSGLSLKAYRQYMVTHEVGHILGYDHTRCPGRGVPAPVMLQQTLGIGPCNPNTRVTKYDRK